MNPNPSPRISRRDLQLLLLRAPGPLAAWLVAGHCSGIALAENQPQSRDAEATPVLAPTPSCGDDDDLTITDAQTAGPFFTPNSPDRNSLLEEGIEGEPLVVTGYVYSPDCEPVASALLDFWQADDSGAYDNQGFRLRGHQFTDADGRFELETVIPGLYPGRTRHIHVRVQAPNSPVLTTQLYFPNEPGNNSDGIFDENLVMDLQHINGRETGFFTFVVLAS